MEGDSGAARVVAAAVRCCLRGCSRAVLCGTGCCFGWVYSGEMQLCCADHQLKSEKMDFADNNVLTSYFGKRGLTG